MLRTLHFTFQVRCLSHHSANGYEIGRSRPPGSLAGSGHWCGRPNRSISNVRPAVSILSIEPNSGFYAPTNIALIASACDPSGGVGSVEFYNGTNKLGQVQAEPYSFTWTNVGTGTFSLTARATVHGSLSVTSTPVAITVLSPGRFNHGYLKGEVYRDILGGTLDNLTNNVKFPDHPDFVGFVSSFEAPTNVGEHYGQRLSGYCEPPLSGEYAFYISSDDQGALFLSTDESPAHKRLIASEPAWNGPREWINGKNQQTRGTPPVNVSTNIFLQTGHKYYVEALMKQNIGGDNVGVTWQFAGTPPPANGTPPIQGNVLGVGNPYSLSIVDFGGNAILTWTSSNVALEQANSLNGPWAAVAGSSSPWPIPPGGPRRFFRLRAL